MKTSSAGEKRKKGFKECACAHAKMENYLQCFSKHLECPSDFFFTWMWLWFTLISSSSLLLVDCLDPTCSGHGTCISGQCLCKLGWTGPLCDVPRSQCPEQCHGHGVYSADTGLCTCEPNWMGPDCSMGQCSLLLHVSFTFSFIINPLILFSSLHFLIVLLLPFLIALLHFLIVLLLFSSLSFTFTY